MGHINSILHVIWENKWKCRKYLSIRNITKPIFLLINYFPTESHLNKLIVTAALTGRLVVPSFPSSKYVWWC